MAIEIMPQEKSEQHWKVKTLKKVLVNYQINIYQKIFLNRLKMQTECKTFWLFQPQFCWV